MSASVSGLNQVAVARYCVAATTVAWSVLVALCGVTSVVTTTLIVTRPAAVAQIDRIIGDDRGAGYRVGGGNGLGLCAVEVLSIRHVLLLGQCRHVRGR